MHPLEFLNVLISQVARGLSQGTVSALTRECLQYIHLSNDDLKHRSAEALAGRFHLRRPPQTSWLDRALSSSLISLGLGSFKCDLGSLVALGVEAFRRAPADLPAGSTLYAEQILAASVLTSRALVEMETGEGKTYAILPAAFALACQYQQVYVICASEYLAWRDASRTRVFWDFVGLPVGLGVEATPPSEWGKRVVYTSLQRLIFKELNDSIRPSPPTYPLTYGAALLDEVDAILLDQGADPYTLTIPIESEAYDWSTAFELCESLEEGKTILVDRAALTASLTQEGEDRIRGLALSRGQAGRRLLVLRQAVELAFLAAKVVRKDIDYIIDGLRAFPVDRISGRVNRTLDPAWLTVLETHRGLAGRPQSVTLNTLRPLSLFRKFAHLSGTSGTVVADGLEFLLAHKLLPLRIAPRFPRVSKKENDQVYRSKTGALTAAVERAIGKASEGRPVLIGTQTIADAEAVAAELHKSLPADAMLTLLTGRDDSHEAAVFETAGRPGRILVATQLAGRGVDIRLSDEARAKGGLDLISVGHALQLRHDRQFLGRAGRHGDPFSAIFICSLEDELMVLAGSKKLPDFFESIGMGDGDAIEHPLVTRAIREAQRQHGAREFLLRRSAEFRSVSEDEVYSSAMYWFSQLQGEQSTEKPEIGISKAFLATIVDRFLVEHVDTLLTDTTDVDRELAQCLQESVLKTLDVPVAWNMIVARDLEGRSGEVARSFLRTRIIGVLEDVLRLHRIVWHGLLVSQSLHSAVCQHTSKIAAALEGIVLATTDNAANTERESRPEPETESFAEQASESEAWKNPAPDGSTLEVHKATVARSKQWRAIPQWQTMLDACGAAILPLVEELRKIHKFLPGSIWESSPALGPITGTNQLGERLAAMVASGDPRSQDSGFCGEAATDAEGCHLLLQLLEEFRADDASREVTRRDLLKRDICSICHWSFAWSWIEFLEERERVRFRCARQGLRHYEYFRVTAMREEEAWQRAEASLPARVLACMLRSHYPHMLGNLFFFEDRRASTVPVKPQAFEWKSSDGEVQRSADGRSELVDAFVAAHEGGLDSAFSPSHLLRLLEDFLRDHPVYTLGSARTIQSALESWAVVESERGVSRSRRQVRKRWLREFLLFLRARRLVGPLPRLRDQLHSASRQLTRSLAEPRTLIPALGGALFLGLFSVVAWKGDLLSGIPLPPVFAHLDAWATGGLVAAGNLLAPAVAGLLAAALLPALLAPAGTPRQIGVTPLERWLAAVTSALVAVWMTWPAAQVGSMLQLCLQACWFVSMMILAVLCRRVVLLISIETSIDLIGAWLCYCALVVVGPLAAGSQGMVMPPWILVLLLALLAFLWRRFHAEEVELASAHLLRAADPRSAEEVTTALRISGTSGGAPFMFALALTWVVAEWEGVERLSSLGLTKNPDRLAAWTLAGLYVLVLAGWSLAVLSKRFDLMAWRMRLNRQHQEIVGVEDVPQLRGFLRRLRRRFITRELLFYALLVVGLLMALGDAPGHGSPVPLVLMLISAGFLVGSEFPAVASQVRGFLGGRGGMDVEVFDIDRLPEPEEKLTLWRSLHRAFQHRPVVILTVLVTVLKAIEFLSELWSSLEGD